MSTYLLQTKYKCLPGYDGEVFIGREVFIGSEVFIGREAFIGREVLFIGREAFIRWMCIFHLLNMNETYFGGSR